MSRAKTVKSKSSSKTPRSGAKNITKPAAAAKASSSDFTPDECAKTEHRAESLKDSPAEGKPWSEWQWCEAGQMCYRGRKDSKGDWEYEFAPLPEEDERPYTPPRGAPIEYSIEEFKIIWEPRPIEVPDDYPGILTPTSATNTLRNAADDPFNVEKTVALGDGERTKKGEEEKTLEGEEESVTASVTKTEEHGRDEKPFKEKRPAEKRGRQLERKHFNQKESKERVDKWRRMVE